MSSIAIQRVLVRMLHDPRFASAVYARPRKALADTGLDLVEMDWIVAADRRAFGVDRYRASRALHALVEEFPLTSAIVLRERDGLARLQSFFSHPIFHQGVQRGDSMAALYAAYLGAGGKHGTPALEAALELESALARARRHRSTPDARWQLADGVGLLLDARLEPKDYAAALDQLGTGPKRLETVLDAGRALTLPQPVDCFPLLLRGEPEVELEALSEEVAAVLAVAHHGAVERHWLVLAEQIGADGGELRELLAELTADRILRAPQEA